MKLRVTLHDTRVGSIVCRGHVNTCRALLMDAVRHQLRWAHYTSIDKVTLSIGSRSKYGRFAPISKEEIIDLLVPLFPSEDYVKVLRIVQNNAMLTVTFDTKILHGGWPIFALVVSTLRETIAACHNVLHYNTHRRDVIDLDFRLEKWWEFMKGRMKVGGFLDGWYQDRVYTEQAAFTSIFAIANSFIDLPEVCINRPSEPIVGFALSLKENNQVWLNNGRCINGMDIL